MTAYTTITSPLGDLLLVGDEIALTSLSLQGQRNAPAIQPGWRRDPEPFAEAIRQLGAYFDGELTEFDIPFAESGTEFQRRVWAALTAIPFGTTASYGQIAVQIGMTPSASRAVGLANGRNPIAIVVPCHRVVGANGKLVGYAGGLDRKRHLLKLEDTALV